MTAALSGGTGPPGGASGLTPSALLQCEDAPNALLQVSPAGSVAVARDPGAPLTLRAVAHARLQYLGHRRGFGATFGILLAYLAVMHAVTYVALRLCVRHEKR